jgi:hypothetical protein
MEDRDKRDFYRLPDTILVEHVFVSEQEAETGNAADFFTSDPNFHLLREIYELQLESKQLLRSITQENRALGRFLGNLDARVELVAKATMHSSMGELDKLKACDAEISEGGLSFVTPDMIQKGQLLAIRMLFQPSYLGLACFSEVKHCQLIEHEYRIGVEFRQPDVQTQRIIGRHIISRQSEQRRARLHRR